jgi:nitroimidazol reductase NimA-like FMN-containing flavoprotein (pyridoxamine 5'-phosphate oxidase superfamily)
MLLSLDDEQIDQVLRAEVVGRLGCHAAGLTYVVPITYAYDGASVYGHSLEGLKLRLMRASPEVCFEVDHLENPGNWQSVIAWGRFEELRGEEAAHALTLLSRRLAGLVVSETSLPGPAAPAAPGEVHPPGSREGGPPATVYRIRLRTRTGRLERR